MSDEQYANTADPNADPVTTYGAAMLKKLEAAIHRKMRKNAHKGHWKQCDEAYLIRRTDEELTELFAAIANGEADESVWDEAADVCLFTAYRADNATRKPLITQIRTAIENGTYRVTTVDEMAKRFHERLLTYGLTAATHVLAAGVLHLPLAVFDRSDVSRTRMVPVLIAIEGKPMDIEPHLATLAAADDVSEIVILTTLNRFATAMPHRIGSKAITTIYLGASIQ